MRQKCDQIIQYRKVLLVSAFLMCHSQGLKSIPVWKNRRITIAINRSQSRSYLRVWFMESSVFIVFFLLLKETAASTQSKAVFIGWKSDFIKSNVVFAKFKSFKVDMITISPASIQDASQLNKLVNSAYRGDESKKGWTTEADLLDGTRIDEAAMKDLIQKAGTTILKYEEDNDLLGCVELRKEGKKLYLGMLSVKPNTQGKGIGKALLQAAEVHAQQKLCPAITMTVIDGRQELIDWYIRNGYQLTGERKPFIVPDERWGIPKRKLEFVVLEKKMV